MRNDYALTYLTPPHHKGLGTDELLQANNQAIQGSVIWLPREYHNLIKLDVRLPPNLMHLAQPIIASVNAEYARSAIR